MNQRRTFVIVGAGLAGAKAAQTLREDGFDGDVILLGQEPGRPYERPPLSKGLLLDSADRETAFVHQAGWYAEHDVDLRTGVTAAAIDQAARQVELADGQRIGYDAALLATGSTPRPLDVPGGYLDGVLQLRTLPDSDRIGAALVDGTRLVVVGAGWIGPEIAAAARQRGAAVTVVERSELPLPRVFGPDIAAVFADLHRERGVHVPLRRSRRGVPRRRPGVVGAAALLLHRPVRPGHGVHRPCPRPAGTTPSSCAAISPRVSSSRSGPPGGGSWPARTSTCGTSRRRSRT